MGLGGCHERRPGSTRSVPPAWPLKSPQHIWAGFGGLTCWGTCRGVPAPSHWQGWHLGMYLPSGAGTCWRLAHVTVIFVVALALATYEKRNSPAVVPWMGEKETKLSKANGRNITLALSMLYPRFRQRFFLCEHQNGTFSRAAGFLCALQHQIFGQTCR